VYGYYAKASIRNLVFCTRIQRDLANAIRDHIVLLKILEYAHRENTAGRDFPAAVRSAVASALFEEGLHEGAFLRSVGVSVSAYPWIGRGLYVHCQQLDRGLAAWARMEEAKGVPLFKGNCISSAFTLQRLQEQWRRIREAFVQVQMESGRLARQQVEAFLMAQEASYQPRYTRKVARWMQQWRRAQTIGAAGRTVATERRLLQRFEWVVQSWRREAVREVRRKQRAQAMARKYGWMLKRKRCWDGKESMADFQRRVRGRA